MSDILPPLPGPTRGLKIGLFGGSFNPAHSGHLHVAETALKRCQLDWIWWLVARGNPLKSDHGDFHARLESARRVVGQHPRMAVTHIEARLGLTYTCHTLAALIDRAPGAYFTWIMGSDSLADFHRWKDWKGIAQNVPIACIARPGSTIRAQRSVFASRFDHARIPETEAAALPWLAAPAWAYLTAPLNPSSSTAMRGKA